MTAHRNHILTYLLATEAERARMERAARWTTEAYVRTLHAASTEAVNRDAAGYAVTAKSPNRILAQRWVDGANLRFILAGA